MAANLANAYVSSLQERLDEIVHGNAARERDMLDQRMTLLLQAIAEDKSQLAQLRASAATGDSIERLSQELDARKSTYFHLFKQREASQIAQSKPAAEFVIVDQARPLDKQEKSKAILLIPIMALVGLTLGVVLALLRARLSGNPLHA
ncbi:hypothetical protein D3C86_1614040 [compost metagenome]